MDLKLRAATPDDVEALCETFFAGFQDELIAKRVFPSDLPSSWDFWREAMAEGLQDPCEHTVVAEDMSTAPPTVVGFAKWKALPAGTEIPQPPTEWPADPELGTAFFHLMWRKHKEMSGGRPHWYLDLLTTKKDYQKKGIGRMLVEWGLERVDAEGVECCVSGTPEGMGLYEKYGFKEVDKQDRMMHSDGQLLQVHMRREKRGA